MKPALISIGTANPPYKQSQAATADLIISSLRLEGRQKKLLQAVYQATGIEERSSVLADYCSKLGELEFFPNTAEQAFPSTAQRMSIYKKEALPLALAAVNALQDFSPEQITHVLTVSCTGMYAPGLDIELVQHLKLASAVKRTAIHFMGCYGAFNALKLAESICKAEPRATVLVVCVELCTLHFQKKWSLDNLLSNALFADGAAAALVQAQPSVEKFFSLEGFYSEILPQSSQAMAWEIGDQGFDLVLSSYVPEIIGSGLGVLVERLLAQSGLALADLDFYALHPGGRKILEACEQALKLNKEANRHAYEVLRSFGNMSSPTVLFVLKSLWAELSVQNHEKTILSCAFGPGLTAESMLLRMNCPPLSS